MKSHVDTSRAKAPIYWYNGDDDARHLRTHRYINDEGDEVVEKHPIAPWRRFVNPHGDVINLQLTGAAADRKPKAHIVERKTRKGFVPYDECPVATHLFPVGLYRDDDPAEFREPCKDFVHPKSGQPGRKKPYTAGAPTPCCQHVQRIIDVRRAKAGKRAEKWKAHYEGDTGKMAKALDSLVRMNEQWGGKSPVGAERSDVDLAVIEEAKSELVAIKDEIVSEREAMRSEIEELRALKAELTGKPEKKGK